MSCHPHIDVKDIPIEFILLDFWNNVGVEFLFSFGPSSKDGNLIHAFIMESTIFDT